MLTALKIFRLQMNIQQQDLAALAGTSNPTLHRIENGKQRCNPALKRQLAKALKTKVSVLFPKGA